MRSFRRAPPALWLAALSLGFFVVPHGVTGAVRVTLLAGFQPFRSSASSFEHLGDRALNLVRKPSDEELLRKLEFYESKLNRLHQQVSEMQTQIAGLARVRQAVGPEYGILTADVVLTSDTSNWRRTAVVAMGTTDGVAPGLPVVWHNALVGRVAETGPYTSRVVLTTDPSFVAGAVTVPQLDMHGAALSSRDVGIAQGDTEKIRLKWLTGDRVVEPGTQVVTTSDPAHHIPKGLLVGTIVSVSRGRGPYSQVEVEPPVNVHALEFVMILKPMRSPEEVRR